MGVTSSPRTRHDLLRAYRSPPGTALVKAASPIIRHAPVDTFSRDVTARETLVGTLSPRARAKLESISTQERAAWHLAAARYQAGISIDSASGVVRTVSVVAPVVAAPASPGGRIPAPMTPPLEDAPAASVSHPAAPVAAAPAPAVVVPAMAVEDDPRVRAWVQYKLVLKLILDDMSGDVATRRARATAAFHTLATSIPGGVTAEDAAVHERMLALVGPSTAATPATHARGASAFNTSPARTSPSRKGARTAASPRRDAAAATPATPSFVTNVATALLKGQHPIFSPPRRTRKAGAAIKRAAAVPQAQADVPTFLRARTLHAFHGIRDNKEVTFSPGEEVLVFNSEHDGWWYGEVGAGGSRRRGWFPRSYVAVDTTPSEVTAVAGGGGAASSSSVDDEDDNLDGDVAIVPRPTSHSPTTRGRSRSPTGAAHSLLTNGTAASTASAGAVSRERTRGAAGNAGGSHFADNSGEDRYDVMNGNGELHLSGGRRVGSRGRSGSPRLSGSPRARSPLASGAGYIPASHTAERAATRAARERGRIAGGRGGIIDSDGEGTSSVDGGDYVGAGEPYGQAGGEFRGQGAEGRGRSRSPVLRDASSPYTPASHTAERAAVRAARGWAQDGAGPRHGAEPPASANGVFTSAIRGLVEAHGQSASDDVLAATAQYQQLAMQMRRPGGTPSKPGARSPAHPRSRSGTVGDAEEVEHVLEGNRPGGAAFAILGSYDHAADGTSAPTAPTRLRSDPWRDEGDAGGGWSATAGTHGSVARGNRYAGAAGGNSRGYMDGISEGGSASQRTAIIHDDVTDGGGTESTFYDAAGGMLSPVRLTYDASAPKGSAQTHGITGGAASVGANERSGNSGGRRANGHSGGAGGMAGLGGFTAAAGFGQEGASASGAGTNMGMFKELAAITGAWEDGGNDGPEDDGAVGPGSGRLALSRSTSPNRMGGAAAMPNDSRAGRGGKYDASVAAAAVSRSRSTSPTEETGGIAGGTQALHRARSPVRSGRSRSPVQFADAQGTGIDGIGHAASEAYSNALSGEMAVDSARGRAGTMQRQLSFDFGLLAPDAGGGGGSSGGSATRSDDDSDDVGDAATRERAALASAVARIASDPIALANLSAQTGIPMAELAVTAVRHAVAASKAVDQASSRSRSGSRSASRLGSVAHSMGATLQADQDELAAFETAVANSGGTATSASGGLAAGMDTGAVVPYGAIQVPGGLFYPVAGAPGGGFFVPAGAAAAAAAAEAAAAAVGGSASAPAGIGGVDGGSGGSEVAVPANFTVVQGVDGRRVKVLAMDGRELWDLFRPRMRAFAIVVGLLRAALRRRMALKVFMLGTCLRAVRERRMARYRAKIFCVGLSRMLYRQRRFERVCVKVFAVGVLHGLDRSIKKQRAQSLANALAGMGGPARAAAKKSEPIDPNAPKTKAIHWDALSRVEGTIWDRKGDDSPRDGDVDVDTLMPELISKFTVSSAPAGGGNAATSDAAAAAAARAQQVISLLDPKTARNVGIALSNIVGKRNLADVRAALLAMDEAALGGGLDRVQLLAGLEIYTEDKTDAVKSYDGDPSKLDLPSRFIRDVVLTTANLPTRLSVMEFKLQLPELLAACHERINTINMACDEISNSTRFATLLLDVILPLGNKLNTLSRKGAAAGFKISSLNKLVQTKSSSGETFLRFIVEGLMEKSPQVLAVADDFPTLQRAKGPLVSMPMISTDLAKLEKGARHVDSLLTKARATKDAELMARLAPLHEQSRAQLTELKAAAAECTTAFEELCRWLGEDPGKTTTEDLFATIQTFLTSITKEGKAAQERAEKVRKAEAKKRKEEDARAAKEAPQQLHKSMRRLSRAMSRADAAVLAAAQIAAAAEAGTAEEDASPSARDDGDSASTGSRDSKWAVVRRASLAARAVAAALNVSKNARRASIMMRMSSDGSEVASLASPTSSRPPPSSRSEDILEAATGLESPVARNATASPTLAPPRGTSRGSARRLSVFDMRQMELAAAAAAAEEEEDARMAPPVVPPPQQRQRSPSGATERPRSMRGAPTLAVVSEVEEDEAGFARARAAALAGSRPRTPSAATSAAPKLAPAPPARTPTASASPSPSPSNSGGSSRRPVSSRNLRLGAEAGITAEQVTATMLPPRTPKAPVPATAMQLQPQPRSFQFPPPPSAAPPAARPAVAHLPPPPSSAPPAARPAMVASLPPPPARGPPAGSGGPAVASRPGTPGSAAAAARSPPPGATAARPPPPRGPALLSLLPRS